MKIRKSLLLILLLSFGLTGCYTQLEYSQKMQQVTDEKPNSEYAWSEDSEDKANLTEADSIYIAETYGAKVSPYREGEGDYGTEGEYYYEDEGYIPIEYKNYDVIDTYDACNCNPYKTYVIYNSYNPLPWYYGTGYHHYNRYNHWSSYYTFGYPHYSWRYNFGFNYYHRGFGLAFHWGSPYHHYYDPFFYDPFYYGYGSHIYYNNYYFGSGYGYAGNVKRTRDDRRYGRRSIGTDRVRDGNSSAVRSRTSVNRGSKANTGTVRTRSTGVQRTRGTVGNTRSTTVRSRGTNVGSSDRSRSGNTRSRGTVKRSRGNGNDGGSSVRTRRDSNVNVTGDRANERERISNTRSRVGINRSGILLPSRADRAQIENRIRKQRVEIKQLRNNQQRSRSSFFGRFQNFIDMDRSFNSSRSHYGRSFNNSGNSRSRINTGSKSRSSSRSSVTRSRSSSKSSSSRSRGSGGSSSSSSRDRGNN